MKRFIATGEDALCEAVESIVEKVVSRRTTFAELAHMIDSAKVALPDDIALSSIQNHVYEAMGVVGKLVVPTPGKAPY